MTTGGGREGRGHHIHSGQMARENLGRRQGAVTAHVTGDGGLKVGEMADAVRRIRVDAPLSKAHLGRDRVRGKGECWANRRRTGREGRGGSHQLARLPAGTDAPNG